MRPSGPVVPPAVPPPVPPSACRRSRRLSLFDRHPQTAELILPTLARTHSVLLQHRNAPFATRDTDLVVQTPLMEVLCSVSKAAIRDLFFITEV